MITIVGLGNILQKDEGVGVHFVQWFQKRHDYGESVNVVDGGTLGFLLLDLVCQSELLLVVDAVQIDAEPGSLFRFTPDDIPPEMLCQGTVHDVTFLQVLSQAELMQKAPRESVILGIVPEDMKGVGLGVSPIIEKQFPRIETLVLKELKRWGVSKISKEVINN